MALGAFKNRILSTRIPYVKSGLIVDLDAGNVNSYSGSGTTWTDLSEEQNDFTMTGSLSFVENGESSYFVSTASIANYWSISSFAHPTGAMTAEMWLACDVASDGEGFYSYAVGTGTDSNENLVINNSSQNIRFYLGSAFTSTTQNISNGNWTQMVRTSERGSGAEVLYLNGELMWSGSLSARTNFRTNGTLMLGQEQDSVGGGLSSTQALEGKYSVFRMYDRVLTPEEVKQNYDAIRGRYE